MGRSCSICNHASRPAIDRALASDESLRDIAGQFGTKRSALSRHRKAGHVLAAVVKHAETEALDHGRNVMTDLERRAARIDKLSDACDEWLRSPDDPTKYDIGARDTDVMIIYTDYEDPENPRRARAALSELLARLDGADMRADRIESRHADPRELILKIAAELRKHNELKAKLLGLLHDTPALAIALGIQIGTGPAEDAEIDVSMLSDAELHLAEAIERKIAGELPPTEDLLRVACSCGAPVELHDWCPACKSSSVARLYPKPAIVEAPGDT